MLDMGFIRDIRKVLALLPAQRQNLLFSATFSNEIRALASGLLHDPASVQVTPRNTASELVEQVVYRVDRERKRELLSHLVKTNVIYQALVFTRTKHGANRLAQQLERDGIAATAIHGNKSQPQRVRALADFKANKYAILVATEVAARGLDIDALPHVVNFELPMVPEDYVHRIGRTGRAGVDGEAVSLVCVDEDKMLFEIEKVLGHRIPSKVIEGFEPDPRIRPEPILRGGLGGARPGSGAASSGAALVSRPVIGRPSARTVAVGTRPHAMPSRGPSVIVRTDLARRRRVVARSPVVHRNPVSGSDNVPRSPGDRPVGTAGRPGQPGSGRASRPGSAADPRRRPTAGALGRLATPRRPCPASASPGTAAAPTADQRARPSRNIATDFSIRRWRVSSVFAPSTWRTCHDWLL